MFPTEEELPDDPVTVDDIDPFTVDDEDFDDIDEFATAEWEVQTTAETRVRDAIRHLDDSAGVEEIPETALVPEPETRSILNNL